MKRSAQAFAVALLLSVAFFSTTCGGQAGEGGADSTAMVERLYGESRALYAAHLEDSALAVLLRAADYAGKGPADTLCYRLYGALAQAYERKNLFSMQETYLRRQLATAEALHDAAKTAATHFALGVSLYAQGHDRQALQYLAKAYDTAPADSVHFRARCQLMRGQVCLQTEDNDSVAAALRQARSEYAGIDRQELYHLTEVYLLSNTGHDTEVATLIRQHLTTDSLYARVEQLSLLVDIEERQGHLRQALDDARLLLALTDSVAAREASESMARIHQLQHEDQMRLAAARQETLKAKARARMWGLLALLLAVVAAALAAVVLLRRRVAVARQAELEALRLAEDAQRSEAETRALNEDLQRRYYEHLYAILLPILNAKRSSSGHIDLNEKSWQLIEENTDLVLPRFTRQLRRNHASLTDEDVRFCCLVAMRVPNPVMANIYGIAPSSVAVRKQRMKKKLDECVVNETLETYLSKYSL